MRDKNTTQILKAFNQLLDPMDANALSFEFHKIAAVIKTSGKKIETLTNLDLFSDNMFVIQFEQQPGLNKILRKLYEQSRKKFDLMSLTAVFYYEPDTFLAVLNKENLNHRLLINLIESFNLPNEVERK